MRSPVRAGPPATPRALRAWKAAVLGFMLAWAPVLPRAQTAAPDFRPDMALLRALNAARQQGCGGQPGASQPLRIDERLTAAAHNLAAGQPLASALASASYRATAAGAIYLGGYSGPTSQASGAVRQSCKAVIDPQLTHAGFHQRGNRTWMVLAAPFSPPQAVGGMDVQAQAQREALRLVNQARASARRCGGQVFSAAPPLQPNTRLQAAAALHAGDMARLDFFAHEGRDGKTVADRARRAGYGWRVVAENIAAGQQDVATAVAGWIESPGHCANLMSRAYKDMGLAFAVNVKSSQGIYWAQVFGAQR